MIEAVLAGAVAGGTSILFPTLGEVVAERSGVINLGTEGSMLTGALAAYAVGIETGNPWLGVAAGLAAGAALAAVHAFVVLFRGANQIAVGLVVTFLAIGITALFGQSYVGQGVVPLTDVAVPGLSELPFLGSILFDHDPLTYLSVVAAAGLWWMMRSTSAGLKLRAAGERPEVLEVYGSSPRSVRVFGVLAGGALAGLGGAQLATAFTRNWSEGMVAGRGFVAVGLVIFAAWNPLKAIAGAYLFSGAVALQLELQAQGSEVSRYLLQALPYLVVIAVLVALSRRRRHAAPAALQRVFEGSA
ncbi:ABC transporter permease [Rhabdothermincola salaria]|uniref:ABC transporter permease n=1 Tax=Rhabdothermincola salaria TaxID=2903142 RepID=UPI001E624235|nr:ABC transporter permease [Rhabdothermincola salaria]MCD9623600.1 ABC transporter permease [Rhabdothermincola salaria]